LMWLFGVSCDYILIVVITKITRTDGVPGKRH
jgi:hypothetical protein